MYGLKISNGDFSVDASGVPSRVVGAERIKQELAAWILEPLGTDPIYPRFGSQLRGMVGIGVTRDVVGEVREEILRVVSNYIEYQMSALKRDARFLPGSRVYAASDIVTEIQNVSVYQEMDVLDVSVTVRLAGGDIINIRQEMS